MTPNAGKGVHVMSQMIKQLCRIDTVQARLVVDMFEDDEIAAVLEACSAARVAQTGEVSRDVFDESVARRLAADAEVSA